MLSSLHKVSKASSTSRFQFLRRLSNFGKAHPLTMPALSPTMEKGKIGRWVKKEGDKLNSGDVLAEIETDKATVDFQFMDDDMYLAKILYADGTEDLNVGTPLALIVDDASLIEEVQKGNYDMAKPVHISSTSPSSTPSEAPASSSNASTTDSTVFDIDNSKIMPSARALIANSGISLSSITGTGKGGRILKGDVLAALGSGSSASQSSSSVAPAPAPSPAKPTSSSDVSSATTSVRPGGKYVDSKPSMVRKVIASRLAESKATIPHQYLQMECEIDNLLKLRSQLKSAGVVISVNDLVIKAAAKAIALVPAVNNYFDAATKSIKANDSIDISVAVATEGGLITPIVSHANTLGVGEINARVKELAGRARANKLKPHEFQGGSFTISNLGMFGIDKFTAVINPPQSCILAVGQGEKRVALPRIQDIDNEGPADVSAGTSNASVVNVMTVQLSADARVVDAATAAEFLSALRKVIENPTMLIA